MAGYEGFSPKPFTATQADKEEAFVKAKEAEEEFVKVGCGSKSKKKAAEEDQEEAFVEVACGSKRKTEAGREEAPAAVPCKGADATTNEVVDEDSDSDSDDDDPETCLAKCAARFEEHGRQNMARMPWLKYNDYSLEMEEEEEE